MLADLFSVSASELLSRHDKHHGRSGPVLDRSLGQSFDIGRAANGELSSSGLGFIEIGERVAVEAMPKTERFLEVIAAATTAKRATLLKLESTPYPDAGIFWDGVPIISNDRGRILVFDDEASTARPKNHRLYVSWFDLEPFSEWSVVRKLDVRCPFQCGIVIGIYSADDKQDELNRTIYVIETNLNEPLMLRACTLK